MSPASSRRREGRGSAMLPSQALALNLRAARAQLKLSQQDLAERMSALGHPWTRPTASQVERGIRSVTVDELFGLCLALQVDATTLLLLPENWNAPMDTGLPQLLTYKAALGLMSKDHYPWRPNVVWENNEPVRATYRGVADVGRVIDEGGTAQEQAWLQEEIERQQEEKWRP
jgi:transcriptional regulator with XRE-family HTH domain